MLPERLMTIYYGVDRLPYKDENRTVHYPIATSNSGGTLITGENSTTKLYFFVGQIGGSGLQWIANIKKPDGTLLYQLCTNGQSVALSNGITDYRVELDISQFYADQVGDLYIGIQGYGGDITIIPTEDTYEVDGEPVVLGTGAIKIRVNYSPNVLPRAGVDLEYSIEQQILASLGGKADINNTIFVTPDISGLNTNNFQENQMFFDEETRKFYKLVDDEFVEVLLSIADIFDAYTKAESDLLFVKLADVSTTAEASKIVKRDSNGQINVVATPTQDYHATSKGYVVGLISTLKKNSYISVDTTTYQTLADFLASTGEEGYLYLYPVDTSDLTKGYKQYIWEVSDNVGSWLYLGDTNLDLTPYYRNDQDIVPSTSNTRNIGSNNYWFKDIYQSGGLIQKNTSYNGLFWKYYVDSSGNFVIGTGASYNNIDSTYFSIKNTGQAITRSIQPLSDNVSDIGGSTSLRYRHIYQSGKHYFADTTSDFYIEYNSTNDCLNICGETIMLTCDTILPNGQYGVELGNSQYMISTAYIETLHGISASISVDAISDSVWITYGKTETPTVSSTIYIGYKKIAILSLTADTTITLDTPVLNCYPEYRAFITNSGSSAITLTFTGVATFLTNDEDNVVITNGTNTTISLQNGVTIEVSIENGHGIAINHSVQ